MRTIAGIGWPRGGKPGFIVIVEAKGQGAAVIAEAEEQGIETLYSKALEFRNDYAVAAWHTDLSSPVLPVWQAVDKRRSLTGKWAIRLQMAAFADKPEDNLELYANQIREMAHPVRRELTFFEGSRLPAILQTMTPQDVLTRQAADFPPVAGLGYAVTALTIFKPAGSAGKPSPVRWM